MSDFSRAPQELLREARDRGHVGLHIEQGVPLLDRDLNLLHDLLAAGVQSLFGSFVGDGVAHKQDGFGITPVATAQDFRIEAGEAGRPGSILVQGLQVPIATSITYREQKPTPPELTTPAAGADRVDTVHLQAWLEEEDGTPELANRDDVGMQTSTRLKPAWAVRVTEGTAELAVGHDGRVSCPIATLRRKAGVDTITKDMIVDRRVRRLTVADVVRRLNLVEEVLLVPGFTSPEFEPSRGVAGDSVRVFGTNLDVDNARVFFGASQAQIFDRTPNELRALVPTGLTPDGRAVSVKLVLENRGGRVESTRSFQVTPKPTFAEPGNQFSPTSGPAGTDIVLAGFNFKAGPVSAMIGPKPATVVEVTSNTRIVIRIPADLVPSGGTSAKHRIELDVNGEKVTSNDELTVTVNVPPPVFAVPPATQFDPQSGAHPTEVTLHGQHFAFAPVRVTFGGEPADLVGTPTDTEIVAVVPASIVAPGQPAKRVFVRVSTAGGDVDSTEQFRVRGQ